MRSQCCALCTAACSACKILQTGSQRHKHLSMSAKAPEAHWAASQHHGKACRSRGHSAAQRCRVMHGRKGRTNLQ